MTLPRLRLALVIILGLAATAGTQADDERGFKKIFDGETLKGWRGDEAFWRVENGAIVAESTPENPCRKNQFLVWDQGEVDDFELKLQFRIAGSDQANSGIQFRGSQNEDGHVIGYQADIDRAGQWVGALYDEHTPRTILARRGENTVIAQDGDRQTSTFASADDLLKHIKRDDWNDYSITARGDAITLAIN
ncbi:MAG: DUF1080 domain-containing protein, partial [Planctomycetaceae bacterium]|nr:DUF1080 domain-containing protein [Planctomycetaceae bacterium]